MSFDPTELLSAALDENAGGFSELRYHKKKVRSVAVEKGLVGETKSSERTGVGVRVLENGTWGFASTDRIELDSVRRALDDARRAARACSVHKRERVPDLPAVGLAQGRFDSDGFDEIEGRPIDASLDLVVDLESRARSSASSVSSASCRYNEILEEKGIVTSDGARAWTRLARPELRVMAVASEAGELQRGARMVGVTGGWDCLFQRASGAELAEDAARQAVDLLRAQHPDGGRKKVVLSPAIVGLLTHEAIGHTVEADFVQSGSCAAGKLGQRVASELVTLCDSGHSEFNAGAGGTLSVDDEGVPTERTVVIREGILASYLHDRESAARMGVAPTGNARAWEYADEPLIRMRNTYIEPGHDSLEALIARVGDGYLLDGPRNGQADANGEFMFGTAECWRIQNGKKAELLRGANISGIAFDVLRTVDGISDEFQWDLGSGYCGKGQPAKVDAGGPWLSCEVLVGGRQAS